MNMAKNISVGLRWAIALVLVLGSLIWLYKSEQTMPRTMPHAAVEAPQQPADLPSTDDMQQISQVLTTVANLPRTGSRITAVDSSMFFATESITDADTQHLLNQNELRLIFIGPYISFAVYNGQAVKPGDRLESGGRVLNIDKQGITILNGSKGGIKKIYWHTPEFVQFTKAPPVSMKRTKSSASSSGNDGEKTTPSTSGHMETTAVEPVVKQLQDIAKKQ